VLVCYIAGILIPAVLTLIVGKPFSEVVNPTIINGILTASAIIFGFSTFRFKLRKPLHMILYLNFMAQAFFLAAVGLVYFLDFLKYGHTTVMTMLFAEISLLINLFSSVVNLWIGSYLLAEE